MTRHKYRYIGCGICPPDSAVNNYRLCGNTEYLGPHCIRIMVDDIKLEKWSCDPYSTTRDTRLIKEFNPIVYNVDTRKIDENLTKLWLDKKIEPHEFHMYKDSDFDKWNSKEPYTRTI